MSSHPAADVVARMLLAIDEVDWDTVRASFADEVRVDYSSLSGQPASIISGDSLISSWQGLVPGFDATQHLTGPIVIDESGPDEVTARTSVRGYHWIVNDEWMVAGRYRMSLRRLGECWRIAAITLSTVRQSGVLSLPDAARECAALNPRVRQGA